MLEKRFDADRNGGEKKSSALGTDSTPNIQARAIPHVRRAPEVCAIAMDNWKNFACFVAAPYKPSLLAITGMGQNAKCIFEDEVAAIKPSTSRPVVALRPAERSATNDQSLSSAAAF